MVKEEIVEGIKMGLAKGESLKQAMMSLYNAGYTKDEIEEAVHLMNAPQLPQTFQPQPIKPEPKKPKQEDSLLPSISQYQKPPANYVQPKPITIQPVIQPPPTSAQTQYPAQRQPSSFQKLPQQQPQPAQVVQKFSGYGEKPSFFWTVITFILTFLLLALLGVLVAVYLFRDELADFLSGIL